MPQLLHLKPGTRFRQPDLDVTGLLLMVNECRARVRLDQGSTDVEITDSDGRQRSFVARRIKETCWASTVFVEALCFVPLPERDMTMTTKNKSTTAAKPQGGKPRGRAAKKTADHQKTIGTMSQLDAAAKVLEEATEPMTSKQMVEAMEARKYWTSPGGKTPHATLYSAILREIQKKGDQARFVKTDRGHFRLRTA